MLFSERFYFTIVENASLYEIAPEEKLKIVPVII